MKKKNWGGGGDSCQHYRHLYDYIYKTRLADFCFLLSLVDIARQHLMIIEFERSESVTEIFSLKGRNSELRNLRKGAAAAFFSTVRREYQSAEPG